MRAEDELILLCCRESSATDGSLNAALDRSDLDWNFIVHTCHENNVLLLVADRLLAQPKLPVNLRRLLVAIQLGLQGKARQVADAFESVLPLIVKDHRIILLRGIAYWYSIYKDRPMRPIGDIDLLVAEPARSLSGRLDDHYHVPVEIVSSARGETLEYHHDFNIANGFRITKIDMRGLWDRHHTLNVSGLTCGLLSPEDNLLYLSYHNVFRGFVRLYRFVDLKEIIRLHDIQWNVVLERAREYRLSRAVWINLYALQELFDEKFPDDIMRALRPNRVLEKILLRCFSPELILHDPNPEMRNVHSSRKRNFQKQLLMFLVLVTFQNCHKLMLGQLVRGLLTLYGSLYKIPGLGPRPTLLIMRDNAEPD